MEHSSEIRPLTSLRAIAALLVFLSHYSGLSYGRVDFFWQAIAVEGHAGVTIFFALSGFLITLRYADSITCRRFSFYDYSLKRIARIIPLYWAVLMLVFVLRPYTPFQFYAPLPILNFTLTQSYFTDLVYSGIGPAWSLSVEAGFYLIAPFILWSCLRYDTYGRMLAAWSIGLLSTGMILVWFAHQTGLNQPLSFMDNTNFVLIHSLFGRGVDFCLGIGAALFYRQRRDALWSGRTGYATLLFMVSTMGIVALQVIMNSLGGIISAWYLNPIIAACAALMILSLTCAESSIARILSHPVPVYLGRVSYALYLLHTMQIGRTIFHVLEATIPAPLIGFYLVMNGVSAVFYHLVGKPAQTLVIRAGRWLHNQQKGRGHATPSLSD